ncbi:MAG: hypothetical protein HC806_06690 [Anaerolineae bacterium]|nr:hypothetical protein [Anaerolineae bacterium]
MLKGWLLDIYSDPEQGVVVWLLGEEGERYRLYEKMPHTFYAYGPFPRLRSLWQYLRDQSRESLRGTKRRSNLPAQTKDTLKQVPHFELGIASPSVSMRRQKPVATQPTARNDINLSRTRREDLFSGILDVLAIEVENVALLPRLFRQVSGAFPDLHYYNADVPLSLLYGAAKNVFPMAYCRVTADETGRIHEIAALDSRWEMAPVQPPLRILYISPDSNPAHTLPKYLDIHFERAHSRLLLEPPRPFLIGLIALLRRHDPDLILTDWGDTWLFPYLLELSKKHGVPFNPNRDPDKEVEYRAERSYYTYGQVVYRGQQTHLFGRWHIDRRNAMMFGDYGLDGVLEQARVTGLPVQEVARKSPGAGITAMQMHTALQKIF